MDTNTKTSKVRTKIATSPKYLGEPANLSSSVVGQSSLGAQVK